MHRGEAGAGAKIFLQAPIGWPTGETRCQCGAATAKTYSSDGIARSGFCPKADSAPSGVR
jgi:hypothetical protein